MDVEALLEAPLKQGEQFLDNLNLEKEDRKRCVPFDLRHDKPDTGGSSTGRDRSPGSQRSSRKRRSPSRDRERRRTRSPDRDRRRERRRSRSRSPYDRRRDDRRDPSRRDSGRRHDEPRRPRSRSPPPKRHRGSPSYDEKPREVRAKSPELTEEEHEMRSVFVSQLSARVGEPQLTQFLETNVGPVRDARIIVDRISRRSKGVGYVEFRDLDSVHKAIGLSGTKLLGIPVMIQYTEAERNRQASTSTPVGESLNIVIPPGSDAKPNAPIPYNRLYIGSLHFNLTDQDLRQVFQPFGHVDIVDLHRDVATGKSKGYAFVQFRFQKDAVVAMEKMNNFPLAGRPIRVGLVTDMPKVHAPPPPREAGGHGPRASGMLNPNLDDPDRGGNLSGISRIELMHKLSREEKVVDVKALPMWKPNIPTAASKCIQLKNMFDPAEETERDWHVELREDVRAEVQEKYGDVVDIFLIKESAGEIYVKFASEESSAKALAGLNGRFFGGKRVSASFISDAMFAASRP